MNKKNSEAWERIKAEGLAVDAHVIGNTAYVGLVRDGDKDRDFIHPKARIKQEFNNPADARRDSKAVARAMSERLEIPLHPSIPAEHYKQVPSHTIGEAKLKVMYEQDRREAERDYEHSPKGIFWFWIKAVILFVVVVGSCILVTRLFSLHAGG